MKRQESALLRGTIMNLKKFRNAVLRLLARQTPYYKLRALFLRSSGVTVGCYTYIAPEVFFADDLDGGLIEVGNYASIAPLAVLVASSHPNFSPVRKLVRCKRAKVVVEDGAWIGSHAVILPGVRIGKCSVVAAGAIVTENVPPYTVVAGVPAKVIRKLKPQGRI